jgi:ergothioneine biosynthesis protein EgtB
MTTISRDRIHATPAAADRYQEVRDLTEQLAAPLSPEDQTVQSMPDTSPTKWHRAHVTWFFETFLVIDRLPHYQPFDPAYHYLFNSYYEALGNRHPRPERGLITRPGVAEIGAYRAHVDAAMRELLQSDPDPALADLLELGLNHEQQHQELLLMDIKHALFANPLRPAYRDLPAPPTAPSPALGWIEHEGGAAELGHRGDGFAFDNELPRHVVQLQPFALADRPVTCGEWLAFINDDGYERPELWLSDGWSAIRSDRREAPLYWFEENGRWRLFTLAGAREIDPAEPVCHLSYYEADAYARWAGARLPTEAEWEAVAEPRTRERGFLDLDALTPRPRDDGPGLFGDVWEWTSSAYLPYPRFQAAPGAVGEYNGKFMVGQHVLRGGCCATPLGHVRASYRNFFPPAARWPFSGARLAKDL